MAPASAADLAADSRSTGAGFGRSRRFLAALPDARLVDRVRRGNELAFEVLYDRYSSRILSFCRHMLGSHEEAEDAVQHTFLAAYRNIVEGEREINLKPWLFTIARNRCISMIRARHEQPADELEVSTAGLSEEVEQRAELRDLVRDVGELPVEQRMALLLTELSDLSHPEIATVVGCPAPKVKALVFQARANLLQRREAREKPCREVRADIASLRGRAVRRGVIRRHLSACPGCTAFWNETRRQRELLSLALPVVPTLALKERALAATGALGGGGGGGAAAHCPSAPQVWSAVQQLVPQGVVPSAQGGGGASHFPVALLQAVPIGQQVISTPTPQQPPLLQQPANTPLE